MLVLKRKKNESIMIGDHIKVVVIETRHDSVRIGIDAPIDVAVHRLEIFNEIHGLENPEAKAPGSLSDRPPPVIVPKNGYPTIQSGTRD